MKCRPTAPIFISNPATGESVAVRALFDTGAAMTVVCDSVAKQLQLQPVRKSDPIRRINAEPQRGDVFAVELTPCGDTESVTIEAVGFDLTPFRDGCSMIIGVDLISSLHIANGRFHSYELSRKQPRVRS